MKVPRYTINMFAGDTSPDVELTVTRKDKSIVDLTGASVDFEIQKQGSDDIINEGHTACYFVDAEAGICRYTWQDTDLPAPGLYDAYVRLEFADGQRETHRMYIYAAPRT
jgi:hypothetical protein